MKALMYVLAVFIIASSCVNSNQEQIAKQKDTSEYLLLSTAWYQFSAERKALYYQAFNIAKERIDAITRDKTLQSPAVVLDIDETVLDNSPYQGWCVVSDSLFTQKTWNNWVLQAKAGALNGALEFTNYAKSKGVEVIYVSNRMVSEMEQTIVNLKKAGFPNASEEFIFLKEDTSDKTARRSAVSEKYSIALLVGDNLGDFDHLYDNRTDGNAHKIVDEQKALFGTRFIILPNPMYGTWEKPFRTKDGSYVDNLKKNLRTFEHN